MGHTPFDQTSINLYNNYAGTSYATYTAPQYTTANRNRCPANANIKPTTSEHREYETTIKTTNSKRLYKYVLQKTKLDNGNSGGNSCDITVVNNTSYTSANTKNARKRFNESSVIEEEHNNRLVRI